MREAWRADPELIRQPDEDELQRVDILPEWEQLFTVIGQMFTGSGGGMVAKAQRTVLKGLAWQARKRVAAEPEEARIFVRDALRMIAACLKLEPLELYPDLKPEQLSRVDAETARVG